MLTLNGAGSSAADPILDGLGLAISHWCSSADAAQVNDTFLDPATGAGTNSTKADLTPSATVVTAGDTGSYNDTSKNWTISSTTGFTAGDYIYLSHPSITDGDYEIASIVDGTNFTVVDNPLNGSGNQSAISYQIAWLLPNTPAQVDINSSAGGTQNFVKFLAEDAGATETTVEDSFYVRDAPAGSAYIELEGGDYTGQNASDFDLTLAILSGWANQGGVIHCELTNHSTQSVNNFTWTTGGGTGEKTLAEAEGGLTAAAGDGTKYGRILLKSKSGGVSIGVDISITIDTTGPTIGLSLHAA